MRRIILWLSTTALLSSFYLLSYSYPFDETVLGDCVRWNGVSKFDLYGVWLRLGQALDFPTKQSIVKNVVLIP